MISEVPSLVVIITISSSPSAWQGDRLCSLSVRGFLTRLFFETPKGMIFFTWISPLNLARVLSRLSASHDRPVASTFALGV